MNGNTQSEIYRTDSLKVVIDTPNILDCADAKQFFVRVDDNHVSLGVGKCLRKTGSACNNGSSL